MPNLSRKPALYGRPQDHKVWTHLLLAVCPSISGLQQRVESAVMEALPFVQRSDLQVRLEKCADRVKSVLQGG